MLTMRYFWWWQTAYSSWGCIHCLQLKISIVANESNWWDSERIYEMVVSWFLFTLSDYSNVMVSIYCRNARCSRVIWRSTCVKYISKALFNSQYVDCEDVNVCTHFIFKYAIKWYQSVSIERPNWCHTFPFNAHQ